MKGLRGLFRLGTLTLLALTLMVAMALPSAAADVCSPSQMLDEVEIVSVAAKEAPSTWSAQDLVDFDYDGDIDNGLLEVSFKDIPTDFDFDGYIIEAVPGDDDPGTSDALGVPDYKSPSLIARPAVVGSTVTEVLNLEPGTKYYVTIYAVNHNTVQISPDQRAQDSSSATTLLSAPFLGGLEWALVDYQPADTTATPPRPNPVYAGVAADTCIAEAAACQFGWRSIGLADPEFEGTHFSFYTADNEAGQHYFRWLNPTIYGPFDHVMNLTDAGEQADMLSLDDDGDVENLCEGDDLADGDCGHTHYLFKAVDENGKTIASQQVETGGNFQYASDEFKGDYFQVVYSSESGDVTLSVALGRMVGGKFKAMSDTASVMFEAPDDLQALDQTFLEYQNELNDIVGDYDENDDAVRWLGEDNTGDDRSIWNANTESSFANAFYGGDGEVGGISDSTASPATTNADDNQGIVVAHLNNQLK
jgi:hypothetical protein